MKDIEGYHDCVHPWSRMMLADPEYMIDVFFDFIAELGEEDKRAKFDDLIKDITRATHSGDTLTKYSQDTKLAIHFANTISMYNAWVGATIVEVVRSQVEAYVDKYAEEWFNDVLGYLADMEEGQREDYEYEKSIDRKLGEA